MKELHETYNLIRTAGIGEYRFVIPSSAKDLLHIDEDEFLYSPETPSGSLSRASLNSINTYSEWADLIAIIHPTGKNTETLSLLEEYLLWNDRPLVITSEVLLSLKSSISHILNQQSTSLVANIKDLQEITSELKSTFALKQRGSIPSLINGGQKLIEEFNDVGLQIIRDETILTINEKEANLTQTEREVSLSTLSSVASVLWLHNLNERYKASTLSAYLVSTENDLDKIKEEYG